MLQSMELLGRTLAEARSLLGDCVVSVLMTGPMEQGAAVNEEQLRVARVQPISGGFRLTVVLPPVLREGF